MGDLSQPDIHKSKDNPFKDELLTVREVATYLRVKRVTVWRWCKQGTIPAFQVGRSWRIRKSDLLRLGDISDAN
jgi:excisionase family DNA binding protein